MTRILADLPDEDIKWLDALAAEQGKSRASILREAVSAYRADAPPSGRPLACLLPRYPPSSSIRGEGELTSVDECPERRARGSAPTSGGGSHLRPAMSKSRQPSTRSRPPLARRLRARRGRWRRGPRAAARAGARGQRHQSQGDAARRGEGTAWNGGAERWPPWRPRRPASSGFVEPWTAGRA